MWKQIFDTEYEINEEGSIRRYEKIRKKRIYNGYYRIDLWKDGETKYYLIHRLIALYFIPNPNNLEYVDHINGITTDNRIENLRWVTNQQNNWNNKSKGFHQRGNKYVARINHNGKQIHIGTFDTPEEARQSYEAKFLELRGGEFLRN